MCRTATPAEIEHTGALEPEGCGGYHAPDIGVLARGRPLDRKAINLAEDLGEAHKAAEYGHKGEPLQAVLHLIRQGD
jgi:hypothetical protein